MGIYNTIKSKTYYEFIASQYCHIRERRLNYLNAIDELIIENFSSKVCNVLDVGAGDGYRGLKIFKALDASYILLLDESPEMLKGIDSVSPEIRANAL